MATMPVGDSGGQYSHAFERLDGKVALYFSWQVNHLILAIQSGLKNRKIELQSIFPVQPRNL